MERLAELEKEFEEAEEIEDFGWSRIEELFAIAKQAQNLADWRRTKPRKEDVDMIKALQERINEYERGE